MNPCPRERDPQSLANFSSSRKFVSSASETSLQLRHGPYLPVVSFPLSLRGTFAQALHGGLVFGAQGRLGPLQLCVPRDRHSPEHPIISVNSRECHSCVDEDRALFSPSMYCVWSANRCCRWTRATARECASPPLLSPLRIAFSIRVPERFLARSALSGLKADFLPSQNNQRSGEKPTTAKRATRPLGALVIRRRGQGK